MTAPVKITVWDVEHGVCIFAVTPNKKRVILDCGASSEFSPAIYLHDDLRIKKIDHLIISHPHADHINDIDNLLYFYENDIKVYKRNEKISKDIVEEENPELAKPPNDKKIKKYFQLDKKFTKDVDWDESPRNPNWGIGCTFHSFQNNNEEFEINDRSVVTFIKFGDKTILYGADLKEDGWLELLKNEKFVNHLKDTTILIESHHGNKSGFCSDAFKHFEPELTIISAGRYREFDGNSLYDGVTTGMTVNSKNNGKEKRKVISTRNDGNIELTIYDDREIEVQID